MYCQRCGNTLAPGARFCNSCGTPMSVTAPAAPISMARPGLVTAIAILDFFGALLMLIFSVASFSFSGSSSTQGADRPVMMVFGAITLLFAAANIVAGARLRQLRAWGRGRRRDFGGREESG